MHNNQLSKLSVQFIAHQRDLHALPEPVLATLIKRTSAELFITQHATLINTCNVKSRPLPPPRNAKA
ncbi:hypothetical protein T10_4108 [Trichinella papuae]|uniref:Uncharacterized protein n=1 Tax=Trichinella papuae TaxID=268474 RepID=A0A0V1N4V5_9BILA|nr:hypothetical protein T10_4108 [Trichinella papuae]